jgi:hypothetical protein
VSDEAEQNFVFLVVVVVAAVVSIVAAVIGVKMG